MGKYFFIIIASCLFVITGCDKETEYGSVVIYHVGTGDGRITGEAYPDGYDPKTSPYRLTSAANVHFSVKSIPDDINGKIGIDGSYRREALASGKYNVYVNSTIIGSFTVLTNQTIWYRLPDEL